MHFFLIGLLGSNESHLRRVRFDRETSDHGNRTMWAGTKGRGQ
jgi:hypothetical protein